jgi:hypothetical protein
VARGLAKTEAFERLRRDQQPHLELEGRVLQRTRGLRDDHDDAGAEQDEQRLPDQGQEARRHILHRPVGPEYADQTQVDHQRRTRHHRNGKDVNRLHSRHHPAGSIDWLIALLSIQRQISLSVKAMSEQPGKSCQQAVINRPACEWAAPYIWCLDACIGRQVCLLLV